MIQWTKSEFTQVAKEWIRICRNEHADPLNPPGLGAKARNAQTVLSRDRQRPGSSLAGMHQLKPLMKAVKDQLELEQVNKRLLAAQFDSPPSVAVTDVIPKPPVETPVAEVVQLPTNVVPLVEQEPEVQFKPRVLDEVSQETPQVPSALAVMLEQQVKNLAQNLAKILVDETLKEMHKAFAIEFPKLQSRAAEVSKNLPKVLVVGPLVKQQEVLEQSVQGMLDLRFVSSEEGAKLISTRGASCVAAVLWTGKISHSHQENAVKTMGREAIKYVTGGLDAIKSTLEDLALQITT